ncbi:Fibrocystin-L [Gossypium australe]|uniref:Fibrocystin-L n=1 Tax=Gossypium australe TaxID=47621 RepID=A0A5B6WWJ0_9ROSI|nr:Fibrocystin-L [Gossypium australe]
MTPMLYSHEVESDHAQTDEFAHVSALFRHYESFTFCEPIKASKPQPELIRRMLTGPCMWNGIKRPCYLFARKFYPETLERLMFYFSNYTTLSA